MYYTTLTLSLVCGLLFGMTACSSVAKVSSTGPDEVLFDRGMNALHRSRFDAARLILETVIDTYPDSPYASKAQGVLRDPRIANCGNSWTTLGCDRAP